MSDPISTVLIRRGLEMAGLVGQGATHAFMQGGNGVRMRHIVWGEQVQVTVNHTDTDSACDVLTRCLAVLPSWVSSLCDEVDRLRKELARVRPTPINLLGEGGCVRQREDGVYLMNQAEKGWASFGVRCEDWDELLRRYNVRVEAPREDKDGTYWPVTPMRKAPAGKAGES